jgi:hypothetical protein
MSFPMITYEAPAIFSSKRYHYEASRVGTGFLLEMKHPLSGHDSCGFYTTTQLGNSELEELHSEDMHRPIYARASKWFCCQCQDGPSGSWQNVCQNCQHKKCSSCRKED